MRYVVTGSAGFIGRHVCAELLEGGHAVLGVDAFTDNYDPAIKRASAAWLGSFPGFRALDLDIERADLNSIFDGCDVIIHLAGQPGVRLSWANDFDVYVQRNITASQRVFEAALRTAVGRIVLASSSSVYGNASGYPTNEDSPTRPFSPYGVTKLAMEQLASAYAENWGLPVVVLRYFTVYGPGQRPDMAIHRFIEHAATGKPVTVYGDGEQIRDFTYVADVASATVAAANADVPAASVYNIAGGSSATINRVVQLVSQNVGRELLKRYAPAEPGDVRITGGSIDRAREKLAWEPAVPLDEGIKRQVAHQLGENGNG